MDSSDPTMKTSELYGKDVYFLYNRTEEMLIDKSGVNEFIEGTIRSREKKEERLTEVLSGSLSKIKQIAIDHSTKIFVPYQDECAIKRGNEIRYFLFARSTVTTNIPRIKNITSLLFDPQNIFATINCDNTTLEAELPTIFRASSKRVIIVDPTSFIPFDTGRVQTLVDNLLKLNSTGNFVFAFHPSCKDLSGNFSPEIDRISHTFSKEYPKLASFIPQPDKLSYDLPMLKRSRFDCGWSCWAVQTAADLRKREEALGIREIYAVASFAAIGAHKADYFGVRLLSSTEGVAKLEATANKSTQDLSLETLIEQNKRHLSIRLGAGRIDMQSWDKVQYFIGMGKLERFLMVDKECAIASFKSVDDALHYKNSLIEERLLGIESVTFFDKGNPDKKIRISNIETGMFGSFYREVERICKKVEGAVRNQDGSGFGMIVVRFDNVKRATMAFVLLDDKLVGKTHLRLTFC